LREDFADLQQRLGGDVFVVRTVSGFFLVVAEVSGVAHAAGFVPALGLRVVETQLDAAFRARHGQFCHRVAVERRRIDDAVLGDMRVEHRETVVVLGGDRQVSGENSDTD